jgi:hypothetical protein
MPGRLSRVGKSPATGVAPPQAIREDFEHLAGSVRLRVSRLVEELILMQSVEGRAAEGHGAFRKQRYVNTTMEDTVRALGRDPQVVAAQRQALIDEIGDWVKLAIANEAPRVLADDEGDALLTMGTLRQIEVDPPAVLKGLHLGGLRDNSDVRLEVEQRYGIQIGGGACYLVDRRVMEQVGLNAAELARGEFAGRIAEFRDRGLIVDRQPQAGDQDTIRYLYIRHRQGGGSSDDAAILAGGKLHNPSVALGVFLADAVDTLEKYVPHYTDQDDDLALLVARARPDLAATQDEVHQLTYLCAVPPGEEEDVPDSSLRYMLAIDANSDQTALESHVAYLQGRPYAPMRLAFERVANGRFYPWFEERLKSMPQK